VTPRLNTMALAERLSSYFDLSRLNIPFTHQGRQIQTRGYGAHCLTGQFRQALQHKQNHAEGANREHEDHDDKDDLLYG
jgi:hypothetical protein